MISSKGRKRPNSIFVLVVVYWTTGIHLGKSAGGNIVVFTWIGNWITMAQFQRWPNGFLRVNGRHRENITCIYSILYCVNALWNKPECVCFKRIVILDFAVFFVFFSGHASFSLTNISRTICFLLETLNIELHYNDKVIIYMILYGWTHS